jgi:uncharacterized protein (TIGR03437 family)
VNNFNKVAAFVAGALIGVPAFGQTIFTAGTVNSADYSRSFAPGAIISIFGSNLAATTAQATSFPLPTALGGASVAVVSNKEPLPLFYVSPGQINAELPFDVAIGQVQIAVTTPAGTSSVDTITVSAQAPKIFTVNFSGAGGAVATNPSYQILTAALPAKPADTITLWMNSLGATTGTPVAGQPAPGAAPGSQPLTLIATPTVTINGQNAPVTWAGLTPNMSGLYQVNVQVPFVVLTGPVTVQLSLAPFGPASVVTTQANITIPIRQLGFYYSVLGGKAVAGETLNGVSGAQSALAFRESDAVTWGSGPGFNAWSDLTGLGAMYSVVTGTAVTLFNGTNVVYDNNGLETASFGTFYNNTGGPPDAQKPGLTDLYSMSNYFPNVYAGYFTLAQPATITQMIGYFDASGTPSLPFDPANPYVKYRMNIFSMASGNLPTNTTNYVGDIFTSDTTAGTFAYSQTGVNMISSTSTDVPKPIYRLSYTLKTPLTLAAGQYWFEHDASVRTAPAASSTSDRSTVKIMTEDELGALISSQQVENKSFRLNLFGREMSLDSSFVLPEAVEVHPSTAAQAH